MKETIYVPMNQHKEKFQIKFRDNIRADSTKRFTFFHASKFMNRIFTTGGQWYHTFLFLTFHLFLFYPIALIFDLIILLVSGTVYAFGAILLYLLKKIINWIGVPITITFGIVTLFALAVILFYNFSDFVELIKNIFDKL